MDQQKYEARWANGFWNLFNSEEYRAVEGGMAQSGAAIFGTKKDASDAAERANLNGQPTRKQRD